MRSFTSLISGAEAAERAQARAAMREYALRYRAALSPQCPYVYGFVDRCQDAITWLCLARSARRRSLTGV